MKYFLVLLVSLLSGAAMAAVPETVSFPSRDGKTTLTGYLYQPNGAGPHPAVVMMHGRSGVYSSLAKGAYNATTLSQRHRMWGEFWASRGYLALHVDSFGPRGFPDGFQKHSYRNRPGEVSEQTVRPLDAYGALDYLRTRKDVVADRVGLHGWSNGGMTVLATLGPEPPGLQKPTPASGFRAAIAQYPSCRTQEREGGYRPYAPLLVMAASDDDEVSPEVCQRFAASVRGRGADLEFVLYVGAHHAYDDPGKARQSHEPNRAALADTLQRAEAFFARHLKP